MSLSLVRASNAPELPSTFEACPACESTDVRASKERTVFAYGEADNAVNLEAEQLVFHCADCGLEFTGVDAEVSRHEAVCRHHGLLTPREIEAIRKQYGMGRADFACVTKLGAATIARWERGALLQNAANDRYLRLLALPENWRRLEGQGGEQAVSHALSISSFRSRRVQAREAAYRSEARSFTLTKSA